MIAVNKPPSVRPTVLIGVISLVERRKDAFFSNTVGTLTVKMMPLYYLGAENVLLQNLDRYNQN